LAGALDHVLGPVDELESAVVAFPHVVAGPQPAVAHRLGGGRRVLVVAAHQAHARPAVHDQLAGRAARHVGAGLVDAPARERPRRPADRHVVATTVPLRPRGPSGLRETAPPSFPEIEPTLTI